MHSDILAELYRQYYSSALLYVLSLCRDRALAEEIVHDAFAKAYLSLPDDVPSFPFWLMKVCRNLFYDHARRQKFLTDAPVPEGTNLNSPETLLLQKEGAAALWRAIGKLDAADRELLALQADHKEQVWIWSAALAREVTRPMQLSLAGAASAGVKPSTRDTLCCGASMWRILRWKIGASILKASCAISPITVIPCGGSLIPTLRPNKF